jgi:hypothetical protein
VTAFHDGEHLQAATIEDAKNGATQIFDTRVLFVMVGA